MDENNDKEKRKGMTENSRKDDIKGLIEKYTKKVEAQLKVPLGSVSSGPITTKEYQEFRKQYLPGNMSLYEKSCTFCEKIIKVNPGPKDLPKIEAALKITGLNITPAGAYSFAMLIPTVIALVGSLLSYSLPILTNALGLTKNAAPSFFFVFFFIFVALALYLPLQKLPMTFADSWRLKASNQMVLSVFFMVTYMRHTSNLERAIDFAANHLSAPLSLDLKKILWDVQTDKYESVKDALDAYLDTWKAYNQEFVEAMHLIESSLLEGSEDRRIELLEKSLEVILEETYEKMLHYAQNLKSPIETLHMLGIILPILGLVILPLIVSFISFVKWYHIAVVYNVVLPILVYYMGTNILSKRPTGYGSGDASDTNPNLKKYKKIILKIANQEILISPLAVSILVGFVFIMIGLSPLIIHAINPGFDVIYDGTSGQIVTINTITSNYTGNIKFALLGFKQTVDSNGNPITLGPYGLGATIISFLVPLGLALAIGLYFKFRSENVLKIRENTKALEEEFASALFQLGNRLADGLPAEIAFDRVANTMENTVSGSFFKAISANIRRLGMGIEEAIFSPNKGALLAFPSNIIESSMKVMVESAKKGPAIASKAVLSVSSYIKEIHRVNERLKDLMEDIISSMKMQISGMTPAISGIVIGITSMVSTIIEQLRTRLNGATSSSVSIVNLFGDPIPTFYFQLIVGIYVVQIIYIMTVLSNKIENGEDKLSEEYLLGKNLIKSTIIYIIVALAITLVFNTIAAAIIPAVPTS